MRWTALELGLIIASVLLLVSAAGGEAIRWAAPPPAPAAARQDLPTPSAAATESAPTAAASATTAPSSTTGPTTVAPSSPTAPSTAAPPSPTPAPSATAATPPTAGSPPLKLSKSASVTSLRRGDVYMYVLDVISASPRPLQVVVRDSTDGEVELLAVQTSSGTCSDTNPIDCRVTASRGQPARITARLRVRPDAAPGSQIVSQAVAQDQENNAAVSAQVLVLVEPPLETATAGAGQPLATLVPIAPLPDAAPSPTADVYHVEPEPPTSAPPSRDEPERPDRPAPTNEPAGAVPPPPDGGPPATSTPAPGEPDAAAPATAAPTPPLPPTAALPTIPPEQAFPPTAAPLPDTTPVVPLPDTASASTTVGMAVLLLGLALVIHCVRRVRHASSDFAERGTVAPPLLPLLDTAARLQSSAAYEIERMRAQCQQMIDLLRAPPDER